MKRLPLLLGLVALGLYLALPVERFFSDSQYLLGRVEAGAPPYYNVAYVPLGHLADLALGGWLGTERALEVLSALCVAGAVALTTALARRLGCGPGSTVTAAALLALAPGALFFGGVIEVHAVQLLGAAAALRLALAAGDRRGGAAWLAIVLAAGLALATHLSHALLLPGLLVLAWARPARPEETGPGGMLARPDPERRGLTLGLAGVPWLLGVALAAIAFGTWLALAEFATWSVHPSLQWLGTLVVFGERFIMSLGERGLYPAAEAAAYLRAELLAPLAFLVAGLVVGLALALAPAEPRPGGDARRRFVRRALLACLPALLVLPQGGVLERGGYFLTLAPLLALVLGLGVDRLLRHLDPRRTPTALVHVACLLLVLVQLLLALDARRDFRRAPDARAWASAAAASMQPGDSALVSTLGRFFALAAAEPGGHVRDLARDLDMQPDAKRAATLKRVLAERLGDARYPGDLWLDAALLPTWPAPPDDGAPAWRRHLAELLAGSPAPVEVVGEPPLRLLVVRRR